MEAPTFMRITATDMHSSDTMSRTFSVVDPLAFKTSVEQFEKELPYHRYELMCNDYVEDYSDDIVSILAELEVC